MLAGGIGIKPKQDGASNTVRYMASQIVVDGFNPSKCQVTENKVTLTSQYVNWIKQATGLKY